MTNDRQTPEPPSDPPPAIEAVIAAIDALTSDQQKSWPGHINALVTVGQLREIRRLVAALRPHPSPPPDARQIDAIRERAIAAIQRHDFGSCDHDTDICGDCDNETAETIRSLLFALDRLRVAPADPPREEPSVPMCHAGTNDGDCSWSECPQLRDGEPAKSGRHCPYDCAPCRDGEPCPKHSAPLPTTDAGGGEANRQDSDPGTATIASIWWDTYHDNDWTHIFAFARAVRKLTPKPRAEPITTRESNQAMAERIAAALFTNGLGHVATRLVLINDEPCTQYGNLGGWNRAAAIKWILDTMCADPPAPPVTETAEKTAGRACCATAPDHSGRQCDKPNGHDGEHWSYGGNTLTWSSAPTAGKTEAT